MGVDLLERPKSLFELYEDNCFFFNSKGKKDFNDILEQMKSDLGGNLTSRLGILVKDIAILLEGNTQNQRYPIAFSRFNKFYPDFDSRKLWDYARFICETFEIDVIECNAQLKGARTYLPSQLTKKHLNRGYELEKIVRDEEPSSPVEEIEKPVQEESAEDLREKYPVPDWLKETPKPSWKEENVHGWIPDEMPWDITSEEYDEFIIDRDTDNYDYIEDGFDEDNFDSKLPDDFEHDDGEYIGGLLRLQGHLPYPSLSLIELNLNVYDVSEMHISEKVFDDYFGSRASIELFDPWGDDPDDDHLLDEYEYLCREGYFEDYFIDVIDNYIELIDSPDYLDAFDEFSFIKDWNESHEDDK